MTIHTTDKREENGNSIQAEVQFDRSNRYYNVLFYIRGRKVANRYSQQQFRDAQKAIRYAEVTVANYNL